MRHPLEHLAQGVAEEVGSAAGLLGQPGEDALGQHPGVLGEEAEEDPVQEVGDDLRIVAAAAEREGQLGEVAGGGLGDLGRLERGAQLLGRGEDGPEDREGLRRIGRREVVEGDDLGDRGEAGEVGPDLDRLEVGDDEEGRVLQRVAVALELEVGGLEVLPLALVLPGEEAALPDVGEAVAALQLLGPLLEGVPGALGVGVGGSGLTQDAAQVDEVGLRGRALGGRDAAPLGGELAGRQGADDTGRGWRGEWTRANAGGGGARRGRAQTARGRSGRRAVRRAVRRQPRPDTGPPDRVGTGRAWKRGEPAGWARFGA
jgi:hypothetical protein